MKVICISGKAQHGKDTTARFLKDALVERGNKVLIAHYADLVKYVCRTFFDWDGKKNRYGRSLLQRIGTDVVRNQNENYWVSFIVDMLRFFDGEWDYVLIPDTRFPNEIDYLIKQGFDVVHLRVERENFTNSLSEEQQNHLSETALDNVVPDAYVCNDGTSDGLRYTVSRLITNSIC